jgi:aspartate racemase
MRGKSHSSSRGNHRIGVLGGIGPEATSEFYHKLICTLQEGYVTCNGDYPQVIVNSIPAPELIHETISSKEILPYIAGLKELDSLNPDFILMVCNTIHLYLDQLQDAIHTPIMNLPLEVHNEIKSLEVSSVFVIGTPQTLNQGLYDFEDIETFKPTAEEMAVLEEAIFLFNKGERKDEQREKVKKICRRYLDAGAQLVVTGCTEFAVMLSDEGLPILNTIDVLVTATIKKITW